MIKIIITKTTKNPNFQAEIKSWEENNRYRNGYRNGEYADGRPQEEVQENCLMVQLTDEEYKKVKQEIIKIYE